MTHLQKRQEGRSRELQACHSDVGAMEQIIWTAITWHIWDNWVMRPSQPGFMKGRSCLTTLIFYDKMTYLMDIARTGDVFHLDFSKPFNNVSHNILLEKLAAHGLNGCTVHCVKNCLECWTEKNYCELS